MKRVAIRCFAAAAACSLLAGSGLATVPAAGQDISQARQSLVVEPLGGHDIYTHTTATDYRVGPALMRSTGDLVYRYTCGPAPTGSGEVIRMATSGNGGSTWSSETVVLQPSTSGPEDVLGVCDPAIVKVDQDYFYLAYTGVASDGTRRLFVARAINPGGPFTKWNGTGWTGGVPAPLIDRDALAAGPSLVNRAGNIHLFYNTRITTGPAAGTYQTRHATATLGTNPSTWPTRLTADPGVAITHPGKYTGTDCVGSHWWADTDVKYDETTGKYLAITSDQSSYRWSALQAYESADATTFTRAIITRGDYRQGARNPGQLADPYGHLTPNATKAIGWAHSATCGQADLRYTTTTQNNLTTGALDVLSPTTRGNWETQSGGWQVGFASSLGTYAAQQGDTSRSSGQSELGLLGHALTASSTIDVRIGTLTERPRSGELIGVHFAKVDPSDTVDESGYLAYLYPVDQKLCVRKAGFGDLGCVSVTQPSPDNWVPIRIVHSGANIKVIANGDQSQSLSVTDADHPFLGGYVGLATTDMAGGFYGLSTSDNVPGRGELWKIAAGSWLQQDSGYVHSSLSDSGQLNLLDSGGLTGAFVPRQQGTGTYAATIALDQADDPTAWAGLAVTNDGLTGSWTTGGYLVFLRANGSLGIYKAGTGQVVPDVATGTHPTTRGVRVRLVRTGSNFKVYVDGAVDPFINWTDTSASPATIGALGIANLNAPATFTDVTYSGDDAR